MLSTSIDVDARGERLVDLVERSAPRSRPAGPGWRARARATAAATPPASRMWLSLIRIASKRPDAVVRARRRRAPRTSPARAASGVVLRVSRTMMRPAAASTKRRARVAMPESRCRKLSAVRSAVSSAARGADDLGDLRRPAAHASPSRVSAVTRTRGVELPEGLERDVEAGEHAVGAFTRKTPRARDVGGDRRVGRDVAPRRRPRRARGGRCRGRPRGPAVPTAITACGARLVARRRGSRAARRPAVSNACTRSAARRSASTIGISATAGGSARDGDLRDRHLQRLLRLGPLLAHLEQHVGRPLVGALVGLPRRLACCRRAATRAPRRVGHGARCIEPVLPPRPDFLGHERQERREAAAAARTAPPTARRWPTPAPAGALLAVAAPLHELEVVVAEAPEERLGALQHARVVVAVERLGRLGDERAPGSGASPRSTGARDRRPAARPRRARTSTRSAS